jgi:hypothetical protein
MKIILWSMIALSFLALAMRVISEIRNRVFTEKFRKIKFSPEDPLYAEAFRKARDTLPVFDRLREKFPATSLLMLGPLKEDGSVTHVIVMRREKNGRYVVRRIEKKDGGYAPEGPEFSCGRDDVVDWIVSEKAGHMKVQGQRVHGIFGHRAQRAIAMREGLKLPEKQFRKICVDLETTLSLIDS